MAGLEGKTALITGAHRIPAASILERLPASGETSYFTGHEHVVDGAFAAR